MTFIADARVFEMIPVKKEIKAIGYELVSYESKPYEKKGLFGFLK